MRRYQAREVAGVWSVFDQFAQETLTFSGAGRSQASATALAELLNSLEEQQDWRREADRWPARSA